MSSSLPSKVPGYPLCFVLGGEHAHCAYAASPSILCAPPRASCTQVSWSLPTASHPGCADAPTGRGGHVDRPSSGLSLLPAVDKACPPLFSSSCLHPMQLLSVGRLVSSAICACLFPGPCLPCPKTLSAPQLPIAPSSLASCRVLPRHSRLQPYQDGQASCGVPHRGSSAEEDHTCSLCHVDS